MPGDGQGINLMTRLVLIGLLLVGAVSAHAQDDDRDITPSPESAALYAQFQDSVPLAFGCRNIAFSRAAEAVFGRLQTIPADVTVTEVDADGVAAQWYTPDDAAAEPVIYYLHGGGYVIGSLDGAYRGYLPRLARVTGLRVFAIAYRLAPEHPFPAGLDDALAGYRWLLDAGIDAADIVIAGDSAGGGLALATLLSLRDAGEPLPAGAALLSPWANLTPLDPARERLAPVDPFLTAEAIASTAACYADGEPLDNPLISPVYADFTGLPPLLLQVGTIELWLTDAARVTRRARRAGVDVTLDVWDGQMHVWPLYGAALPEARQALSEIGLFVRAQTD